MMAPGERALAVKMLGRAMQDCGGRSLDMSDARTKIIKGCQMTREDIAFDGECWLRESEQCDMILQALGHPWSVYSGVELAGRAQSPDFDWRQFAIALGGLI
uniref:Uncharacterized protein n=1 Tax=viral metagenome TaxID=1070528 RepID=A0A6M3X4H7_9ZZZZ